MATFFCGIPRTSAKNSSERIEMSGFLRPAAAKMSTTSSEATAPETICRMACSISSGDLRSLGTFFSQHVVVFVAAQGRPPTLDWSFWLVPLRSLVTLERPSNLMLMLALAYLLVAAWALAALAFRRVPKVVQAFAVQDYPLREIRTVDRRIVIEELPCAFAQTVIRIHKVPRV